jgi:septal ring factor EnvC (AmiA/AmiB activator)
MAYWGEALTYHQTLWRHEDLRAGRDALARLREDNARLTAEIKRLGDDNAQLKREASKHGDERRQVLTQIDTLLKDIGKLDLE